MDLKKVNALVSEMKSFKKKSYKKEDLLNEMLALQSEVVEITFRGDEVSTSGLKIWDVEEKLIELNKKYCFVTKKELNKFIITSKYLCNLIRAEISGRRGENKAFKDLNNINGERQILRNVELYDGVHRTEIDAVVIFPSSITIVEVKNTAKNIFINESGNYYYTGRHLRLDCKLGNKMKNKELLLRNALSECGCENIEINSIVVFTNDNIEVENRCNWLKTCFSSQLVYLIQDNRDKINNNYFDINLIKNSIENQSNKGEFVFDFDVKQYKFDFATIIVKLEETLLRKEKYKAIKNFFKDIFTIKSLKKVVSVFSTGVSLLLAILLINSINKN